MVDRDIGQRTTTLVAVVWRAPWIWGWFMQLAAI